jgi:hypothetical protein
MTADGGHEGQGMQINQTKAKIRAGQATFGAFVGLPAPNVVELLGWTGLDFAVPLHRRCGLPDRRGSAVLARGEGILEGLPLQLYTLFCLASAGERVGERGRPLVHSISAATYHGRVSENGG